MLFLLHLCQCSTRCPEFQEALVQPESHLSSVEVYSLFVVAVRTVNISADIMSLVLYHRLILDDNAVVPDRNLKVHNYLSQQRAV